MNRGESGYTYLYAISLVGAWDWEYDYVVPSGSMTASIDTRKTYVKRKISHEIIYQWCPRHGMTISEPYSPGLGFTGRTGSGTRDRNAIQTQEWGGLTVVAYLRGSPWKERNSSNWVYFIYVVPRSTCNRQGCDRFELAVDIKILSRPRDNV